MRKRFLWMILFLSCFLTTQAENQTTILTEPKTSVRKHHGLRDFFHSFTAIDTNFIAPQQYYACTMMLGEKRYSSYTLSTKKENGETQELRFAPNSPFRVGPYVGFSLFFWGYTFDVGAKQSSFNRSNIYLSLYTQFIGVDYYYESDIHNYRLKKVRGFNTPQANAIRDISFPGMSTYFQNLHVYYLFNNKHFSYPAAYSQSTMQKRSSGGLILGFNYTHEKINFDYSVLPQDLLKDQDGNDLLEDNLKLSSVRYRDYSISLGYGYNLVFAKNCLANLTLTPTIGYNFSKGEKFNKEKLYDLDALNFDFISRASIVWNNSKYFAGAAIVGHTYSYKKPTFSIRNSLITASVYTGFNFIKKKKYKHGTARN